MISIILPTYNEAQNIREIIPLISDTLKPLGYQFEILVMDDNSPDGTAAVAEELASRFPVRSIRRVGNRGLSAAVVEGFDLANGEFLVVMDADLSHPVEKLPEMLAPVVANECDITVGSRFVAGGDSYGLSPFRKLVSKGAGLLAIGLTRLSDPTSGFMAFRKSVIDGVELNPIGWKIVLEVVTRSRGRVREIPIRFGDRLHGESKLDATAQFEYLLHLFRLYDFSLPSLFQFIRFCLVGLSGLVVDTVVLVSLVEGVALDPRIASIFAFAVAVTWNYLINHAWTFPHHGQYAVERYLRFVTVCIVGLLVRLTVMHGLMTIAGLNEGNLYVVASLIGVLVATVFNFIGSKAFVFLDLKKGKI